MRAEGLERLSGAAYRSEGGRFTCYRHPSDPEKIVKVVNNAKPLYIRPSRERIDWHQKNFAGYIPETVVDDSLLGGEVVIVQKKIRGETLKDVRLASLPTSSLLELKEISRVAINVIRGGFSVDLAGRQTDSVGSKFSRFIGWKSFTGSVFDMLRSHESTNLMIEAGTNKVFLVDCFSSQSRTLKGRMVRIIRLAGAIRLNRKVSAILKSRKLRNL